MSGEECTSSLRNCLFHWPIKLISNIILQLFNYEISTERVTRLLNSNTRKKKVDFQSFTVEFYYNKIP
jgi:hypothetical protein